MEKIKNILKSLKTIKEKTSHKLFIELSHGNKKLKNNGRVSFLIWNIPAIITCPYATELCKRFCYAMKAEKQYKTAKQSRKDHFEISRNADFVERMIYTILVELDRPANKNKKVVFRIHESGDFYNKAYVEKWLEIMRYFENDHRIVFVAYTKSVKYFDGVNLPANFCLLASVWSDTTPANLEIIKRNNFRIYTAYKGLELENALKSGFSKCGCIDCAACGKCWNNYTSNIVVEIH